MYNKIRVAAAQFHVGTDVADNLSTTLRMLDQASQVDPQLVVLPEFCNHLSWYDGPEHCYDVSVALDGPFLQAIANKARELGIYVVVNCTVQRPGQRATGSSLLYSPAGELLADNTKQIYIGHENDFLDRATEPGPIVELPFGRLGFYACMDGVINETPRGLALRGAQLLCNSLNSFASDEGSLHIPVRAAENKVFVVAANKIGPLVPEEMVGGISEATGIPPRFLGGAGESQIVAPSGEVLARASLDQEEVIYADIDLSEADNKTRPDGTDVFKARRPELYRPIVENPVNQPEAPWTQVGQLPAAILATASDGELMLKELADALSSGSLADAAWVALPPLLSAERMARDPRAAMEFSQEALAELQSLAQLHDLYLSTSLVLADELGQPQHSAILMGAAGICLRQGQIHHSERFAWSSLVNDISTVELAVGRLGLCLSDDSIYPETFRLMAMAGVEVASVPLQALESWELSTGLLERAAENRINLLVATSSSALGNPFAAVLQHDFTVMTPWQERPFDGLLSQPEYRPVAATDSFMTVSLHPSAAANKEVSRNTNLLRNRPWDLSAAIAEY
ncbi:hydrolase [Aestuariicella hydrocarbonica]|uniref:Hydrolase n=2 Tax=Pseudomaricurvus hydrocarbonicus TaxID=1470433 RepID=A0A9E5T1D4_9GAMM|nr:hydrolase [Aestuariicella hydrocarbonica]